jgi:hypothetical protein
MPPAFGRRSIVDGTLEADMDRVSRLLRIAGAAAAAVAAVAALTIAPHAASATRPAPDGPANLVQRIEVPVDDTSSEALQMIVAMAFGVVVATAAHRRSGHRRRDGAPDLDATEPFNVPRPVGRPEPETVAAMNNERFMPSGVAWAEAVPARSSGPKRPLSARNTR